MAQVSYGTITITDITDIDNIQNYYLATSASSGVTTSTSGWTTGIQSMTSTNQYLWNYEQILGTGGVVINTTTPVIIGRYGQNGQPGVSITSIDEYYKANNSSTNKPTSWNAVNVIDKPTASNKYLWNYQVIHYSNNTTEGSASEARIIGVYGDKGEKGDDGISPTVSKSGSTVTITDAEGNTVTVSDGTNGTSYYTHIRYATSSAGANMTSTPTSSTIYIGIYSGTSATAPTTANSYTWSKYMGTNGTNGISVTKVTPIYYLKTSSGSAPTAPNSGTAITSTSTGTGVWTTAIPTYVNGGTYYTSTQTYLSGGTSPVSSTAVIDQALTTANSNAYGAYNVATGINQHFWSIESDYATGIPAGSYITDTIIDTFKSNKTGGNLLTRSDGIWIRNGIQTLASLTGDALQFYNPSDSNHPLQLSIGANGTLQSGNYNRGTNSKFSSNGTKIDLVNGDIITKYFRISQGLETGLNAGAYIYGTIEALDGKIGADSNNYWEIGQYTDYGLTTNATMIGHGGSFIQLGDSSTWRLATNRIHTGWYTSGNTVLNYPSINSKYWDFGIHTPSSGTDKFLYIRNSKANTSASNVLQNLLYDIDDTYDTAQWNYKFYIDASGNVHSPSYYIINDDGSEQTLSGSGLVASSLSCGTVGSLTQPVYFNNGVPATTTYALNAAGAKGVDTSIAAASTSTNLPTSKAVAAFVEGKGYITSYTDYHVKTEARGSTTMYLAGSNTSGTVSQGTLLTDSGVYVQTSSSSTNLVVPKVNGYTLAAASAKGVDTSIAAASTSTNLPTSKAVAAFVEGKGYKTTDNNTTYTFANGTNGFTVTPSGGDAQTVTVTPSISNNITGTGTRTSGYLAKFSGTNTITNGPALGTDTTKFLNNKGEWAVPAGTYTYTLPLAANGTRGGVQIGYTQSGKNYPVQLSSEKMYVNVPWENTTYSAGTGLSLSGTTFNHSNSVTAGTAGTSSATSSTNRTIDIPYVTYDEQGHITGSGTHTHTLSSFPEAYLSWGGRNFSASYGCIDAAMIDVLGANRFAFLKAAGLTIEYSTDGGSNWTDYGATNVQKTGLFGAGQNFYLGKATAKANNTVNNRLRVTIDTGAASIYTVLNKIAIYMSTAGNTVQVLIEKALQSTPTTYSTHLNWTGISGRSGWNILNISELTTYGNTAASQYGRVRFTFKQTAINSNYPSANISRIMGFGGVGWTVPSNMARDGHLYSYDNSQNATFPAQVTATQFNGTATGNITSVQYDSTNKKITYTKNSTNTDVVTVATLKTDLGSMPASDVYSWAKASTKPSYSYSEIGSAPDAIIDATVNESGVIVLTKNSGGTIPLSTEIAVVESQGANKLVEAGTTTGISVGSAAEPVYFSSGVPVKGNTIPKLNNTTTGGTFYAPTAIGTAKQILVSSGNAAPTWQTVATGGTNGTIKIGSDEYSVKGLAAAAYKALADSSSASAIGTGTNVTTERDVYYGLPTINNAHNYTSSTTIYAPTTGGTTDQVLIGNGTTSAPKWTDISGLVPTSATNATNDSDGNPINTTYIKKSIGTAAGDIIYWSASGTPTRLAKGSNGQVLKLADGVPTWGTDNNTWDALSTSQAGYVAKAPNDTAKFLRGDASWAAVTKSNVGLGNVDNTADANKRVKGANITTTENAVAYYTDTAGTFGSKASANGALYATSANGALTFGTLPAAQGGTGKTTLKDACNALINALDTGSSNLTANDYVITQYVGGGTTTTTYHRRPASALRVGGLLTARKLKVALGSTTDVTFDGTADVTNIPISGTLAIGNGGTGLTSSPSMLTNLGSTTAANVLQASPRPGITGTLGVANGGTGATSFTANSVIISGSTTTAALTTRAITNVTSGAVTASTNLVTANSLVAHVANKIAAASDTYVTIATDQTITASQKTFNGAIRWGTASKYGAAHYDSTLEAIVFSFA